MWPGTMTLTLTRASGEHQSRYPVLRLKASKASTHSAELVRAARVSPETLETNPNVPKTLSDEPRKGGSDLEPTSENHEMTVRRMENNPAPWFKSGYALLHTY